VDFAGSGVVHACGGFIALAGAIVLGPRIGKYDKDGKPNAIPGHHIPMAIIGTFILAFGWFGFNPGSTLGAVGGGNLRIGIIATNTMLASAGGALTAILYMKRKFGKFDPSMGANGMLAGLVAITAPCAFVNSWSAVLIGAIAGWLVVVSVFFWEKRGVDDPVGAVSVHGVCGVFGVLALGLFADGTYGDGWNGVSGKVTGLFYGDSKQFLAQCISAVVVMAWAFTSAFVFFKVQSLFMRLRPTAEEELAGLDLPEMGALAYPDFQQLDATSPGMSRALGTAAAFVNAPSGAPASVERA
jgi:Amt family ammonium transporter